MSSEERVQRIRLSQLFEMLYKLVVQFDRLHREKILHRDIKPENILVNVLTDSGKTSIDAIFGDFGLSVMVKETDEHGELTSLTKRAKGTPRYLPQSITTRIWNNTWEFKYTTKTDLYAFGCVFNFIACYLKKKTGNRQPSIALLDALQEHFCVTLQESGSDPFESTMTKFYLALQIVILKNREVDFLVFKEALRNLNVEGLATFKEHVLHLLYILMLASFQQESSRFLLLHPRLFSWLLQLNAYLSDDLLILKSEKGVATLLELSKLALSQQSYWSGLPGRLMALDELETEIRTLSAAEKLPHLLDCSKLSAERGSSCPSSLDSFFRPFSPDQIEMQKDTSISPAFPITNIK